MAIAAHIYFGASYSNDEEKTQLVTKFKKGLIIGLPLGLIFGGIAIALKAYAFQQPLSTKDIFLFIAIALFFTLFSGLKSAFPQMR